MRNARQRQRVGAGRGSAERLEPRTFLSAGDLDPTFGTGGVAYPGRFD